MGVTYISYKVVLVLWTCSLMSGQANRIHTSHLSENGKSISETKYVS